MDSEWFIARMKTIGISQEDVGRALHKHRSVVSRILDGTQPLKVVEIEPLAEALQVPVLEVAYRAGLWRSGRFPSIRSAFVINEVEAGRFASTIPDQKPISAESVLTEYPHDTVFALRVKGNSMDKIAPEGSVIIADYARRDLREGDLGVFRRNDEATFKRLRKSGPQSWLEPDSSDPRNERIFPREGETIEIIGLVVEIRPDYGAAPPPAAPRAKKKSLATSPYRAQRAERTGALR